ncbi:MULTISPECIES: carbon storage regulator CsrA [Legionella]|uniref:Translational regulator CsrA n=1 Tax=Legionella norrlandica TaxID=1498499 RepID=A0A0A2T4B8_9GAMM|nr:MULTISPECIES: carbon storage regulator CsrA [Legionella]HAT8880431.1 carbon storage regulator CsrA [Legionella pneumophila subsp. pneumophila]ABQ56714.1 global regulator (carbon storage regulator) [Legionella pneumophila str. Corby]ADG23831.1 carbon storage regulator [Legionella pneumophila 2300/99 Alcoy]KGP62268.1 carbon storage regulator CsrA [Legionella norrlandica]MCK1856849.1 carbon storage regulator CsrA [Legionella pneumophila]
MLVLTRRVGESVVISEDIYCTIVGYQNDEVRLAFDAPKSIPIHRDEIQRRIYRDQIKDNKFVDKAANNESIVDRLINKFKSSASPTNS